MAQSWPNVWAQSACKWLFREHPCDRPHELSGSPRAARPTPRVFSVSSISWLNPRFGIFETDVDPSTLTHGLWWVQEDRRNVALFAQAYFA